MTNNEKHKSDIKAYLCSKDFDELSNHTEAIYTLTTQYTADALEWAVKPIRAI